jgi:hypothetical protein
MNGVDLIIQSDCAGLHPHDVSLAVIILGTRPLTLPHNERVCRLGSAVYTTIAIFFQAVHTWQQRCLHRW